MRFDYDTTIYTCILTLNDYVCMDKFKYHFITDFKLGGRKEDQHIVDIYNILHPSFVFTNYGNIDFQNFCSLPGHR